MMIEEELMKVYRSQCSKKKAIALMAVFLLVFCMNAQEKIRMVVFDFDILSKEVTQAEGLILSDYIRSSAINTGVFDIISREQLSKILKEYEFQLSGLTDESSAVKIGKILNVTNSIMGTIGKFGEKYLIIIKVLNIETGTYLAGGELQAETKEEILSQIKVKISEVANKIGGYNNEVLQPKTQLKDEHVILSGEWIADKENGIKVWNPNPIPNESISWSGSSKNGKAHGKGTLIWYENGILTEKVDGIFVEGFPIRAIASFASGNVYDGEFSGWKWHGTGTLTYSTGLKYTGQWENGAIIKGIIYYTDGGRYEGEITNDLRSGAGRLYYNNRIVEGEWIAGNINYGNITFQDGSKYLGGIKDLLRSGEGTCYFTDGFYAGNWERDLFSGYGSYVWNIGIRYDGEWSNNIAAGGWYSAPNIKQVWAMQDRDRRWIFDLNHQVAINTDVKTKDRGRRIEIAWPWTAAGVLTGIVAGPLLIPEEYQYTTGDKILIGSIYSGLIGFVIDIIVKLAK